MRFQNKNKGAKEKSQASNSFRGLVQPLIVMGLAFALFGCKSGLENLSGTFTGDFSKIENGEIVALRVSTSLDQANWHDGNFQLSIQDQESHQQVASLSIESHSSELWLKSSLLPGTGEIKLIDRGACSEAEPLSEDQPSYSTFCAQSDVISLFVTEKTGKYRVLLYLSKTDGAENNASSPSGGAFTLKDILRRVMTSSYENRIAAEKLYQAQEETKVVRSHLFPSIGLGGMLSLINYPMAASSMIGSLLPFVFPSNWFQFDRKSALFESEVMGYKVLVANQMSLAEDLFHNIEQDQRLIEQLQAAQVSLQSKKEIVSLQVRMGLAPESDLLAVNDLIDANQNDLDRLQQGLTSQYAILSRGLGISPRAGITKLISEKPFSFAELKPIRAEDLMAEALGASVELRQALFLEESAAYQEKAEFYSFINPSDWISFNESIIHRVAIARSSINEARYLRHLTQSKIEEQVISLSSLYNSLLDQCQRLAKRMNQEKEALDKLNLLYQSGQASVLQVRVALDALFRVQADQIKADASFASVNGKINRLLWRDVYGDAQARQIKR